MRAGIVCLLGVFIAAFFARIEAMGYTLEALKDEIVNLPDAPSNIPRMFSGYIPVSEDGSRRIFYWFMESTEPSNVIAYQTNGGPGCSGILGALTEWSPIAPIKKDGRYQLEYRPTTWNKYANVIYLEQPAGVGFSLDPKRTSWTDDLAATDARTFLVNWFQRFPNYKQHQFVLFSESYGGHYLPTLAQKIHHNPIPDVTFKGFLVGNPLTYMPWRDYGEIATYATHQKAPSYLWDQYVKSGCTPDFTTSPNPAKPLPAVCDLIAHKIQASVGKIDPYALDFPVCSASSFERSHFLRAIREAGIASNPNRRLLASLGEESYFPNYDECSDDHIIGYLNRADVREAIHVESNVKWSPCANINFSSYDMITSMVPIYEELVASGKYDILIYSGDNDSVCATIGEQPWLWASSTFKVDSSKNWVPWYTQTKEGKQVSGYVTSFKFGRGSLEFATVSGAGHMVPSTRPLQSQSIFAKYLGKEKW